MEGRCLKDFALKDSHVRIRYHDLPGDDIPILFIHGLGCASSLDYPDVASQVCLVGYRRILVDLLGSGFSDKPDDFGYTVSDHVDYLTDFVASLDVDRFVLFGHSLGGAVALSLADRCRNQLAHIVVSEANLDSGGGLFSRSIAAYTERDFRDQGLRQIIAQSRSNSNDTWAASCAMTSPLALYRGAQSLVVGAYPSWRDILYSLKCPKSFIFGESSLPDPNLLILSDHGVHIEVVPQAGHSMAWENPKGVANAIQRALNRGGEP